MSLTERVQNLSTENLKACAAGLYVNEAESAGVALDAVLTELELRLNESDFVAFCDSLEAL